MKDLEDGVEEKLDVPYEHDWTILEDIEVNGYRYADVHWTSDKWAPGDYDAVRKN